MDTTNSEAHDSPSSERTPQPDSDRRVTPADHIKALYPRYGRRAAAVARFVAPLAAVWLFVRWLFGVLAGAVRSAVPGAGGGSSPGGSSTTPGTGGGMFDVSDGWFDMPSGLGASGPSPSLGFIDTSGFVEALLGPLNMVSHVVAVVAVLWLARRTWPRFRERFAAATAVDAERSAAGKTGPPTTPPSPATGTVKDRAVRRLAGLFALEAQHNDAGPTGGEAAELRAEVERLRAESDELRAELTRLRGTEDADDPPLIEDDAA